MISNRSIAPGFLALLMFVVSAPAARAESEFWQLELDAAQREATAEKKTLLLAFVSSDRQSNSIRMRAEVLDTDAFRTAAAERFVGFFVDVSRNAPLPVEVRERNVELGKRYRVNVVPSVVLLDSAGKAIGRAGYLEGGGAAYARHLREMFAGHERRTELMVRLPSLTGLERIHALDALIEIIERNDRESDELESLRRELLALDLAAVPDLKRKHVFQGRMAAADQLLRQRKPQEAKQIYEQVLNLELSAEQKQEVFDALGACYFAFRDFVRLHEVLEQARLAAPESSRVPSLEGKLSRFAPPAAAQRSLTAASDELRTAVGIDRAKVLDRIVEARKVLNSFEAGIGFAAAPDPFVEQILELDPDNVAGLKAKYADHAAWAEVATIVRRLTPMQVDRLQKADARNAEVVELSGRKRYAEALPIAAEVLATRREILSDRHAATAQALQNFGAQLRGMQRFAEAVPLVEQALKIRRAQFGTGQRQTIETISMLGALYQDAGNHAASRPLLEESVALQLAIYGETSLENAAAINSLGVLMRESGDAREACSHFERALAIDNARLGPKHEHTLSVLGNLASALESSGNYAAARITHERVATLRRETLGEAHPDTALALANLGELLGRMGDTGAALTYLQQSLTIRRRIGGERNLDAATSHHSLGTILAHAGNFAAARPHLEQALSVRREVLGESHPDTAKSLNNLAGILNATGEHAAARKYYEETVEVCRKAFGDKNRSVAQAMCNLGSTYQLEGDYNAACRWMSEGVTIFQATLGDNHPATVQALVQLASAHYEKDDFKPAVDLLTAGLSTKYELEEAMCAVSSETEALRIVALDNWVLDMLISGSTRIKRTPDSLYASLWEGRSAVYRLAANRRSAQDRSSSPAVNDLHRRWLEARRDVARITLAPAADDSKQVFARREQLQRTTALKEELERQLAAAAPQVVEDEVHRPRAYTDLIKALPADAVFVDIVRFRYRGQAPGFPGKRGRTVTPNYVGFLLARDKPVRRIDFGKAAPIEAAAKEWRSAILNGGVTTADQDLRELVWKPIAAAIPQETKTIYLAPDGPLTSLPWAALPGSKSGTVLLEEYLMAIVPNGRELLKQLEQPADSSDDGALLAVGGVQYGVAPSEAKPHEAAPLDIASASPSVVRRAAAVDEKRSLHWPDLSGTLNEVVSLEKVCGERPLVKLTGSDAGTSRIVAELPKARWAVLATHGFFADPAMRSAMQVDERLVSGDFESAQNGQVGRNPLLLSGLVFAGANLPRPIDAAGVPHGDGGILTAEAIAGLSLSKLELAVLSACETGLGEVAGGEGTFGLQRAFHVAGCRNVVASLWKVDDEATSALMKLFYENLWRKKERPLVALRNAQLSILRDPPWLAANGSRAPGAAKPLPNGGISSASTTPARAGIHSWAAFQLSGAGR